MRRAAGKMHKDINLARYVPPAARAGRADLWHVRDSIGRRVAMPEATLLGEILARAMPAPEVSAGVAVGLNVATGRNSWTPHSK